MPYLEKYHNLVSFIKERGPAAVAFSGGVDSTLLLSAAKEALGERVIALTADLPYVPRREIRQAEAMARDLSSLHHTIEIPFPESIRFNPGERCYLCKRHLFTILISEADKAGFPLVLEGTNAGDLNDLRPGIRALRELGVVSPFLDMGFTKEDIRAASKMRGLPTWDKPANSCLLTRIPHGCEITGKDLNRIEGAEAYLLGLGFRDIRVRSHGDIARIEFARPERRNTFNEALMDDISRHLKSLGYRHVAMELEGYMRGGMNTTGNDNRCGKEL